MENTDIPILTVWISGGHITICISVPSYHFPNMRVNKGNDFFHEEDFIYFYLWRAYNCPMDAIRTKSLTCRETKPGQLECVLDLDLLLPDDRERKRFEAKWPEFLASDPANAYVYQRKGRRLAYLTEHLVPAKIDKRPPLLLILGNPASHSVKAGMFFSFEGKGREHRFWNILRKSNVLNLDLDAGLPVGRRNARRRDRLFKLDYDSPFRIGLAVFVSMPSAASGPWSGVAGVRKLIGARAMRRLEAAERERILECARAFLSKGGAAIAFQKNAWEGLRSPNDPPYKIDKAKAGKLRGYMAGLSRIPLYGVPPTRLAGPAREVLQKLIADLGAVDTK